MKRHQRTLITVVIVLAAMTFFSRLYLAAQDKPEAQPEQPVNTRGTGNFNFLIASGFLCDPPDPDACPAVARASNGATIEISGAGTLDLAGESATGAGAFTVKTPNGTIVSTGVWRATQLASFDFYGLDPAALRDYPRPRRVAAFAIPGPLAGLMAGPVAAGGLAVIRIRLLPDAGSPTDALLRVNCAKGKVPSEAAGDGVRLAIEGGGPVFDEQVSGGTVFLLRRPMPNFAWKGVVNPE